MIASAENDPHHHMSQFRSWSFDGAYDMQGEGQGVAHYILDRVDGVGDSTCDMTWDKAHAVDVMVEHAAKGFSNGYILDVLHVNLGGSPLCEKPQKMNMLMDLAEERHVKWMHMLYLLKIRFFESEYCVLHNHRSSTYCIIVEQLERELRQVNSTGATIGRTTDAEETGALDTLSKMILKLREY